VGQRFAVNWNTGASASTVLFSANAPGVLGWTNLQFIARATQDSTTLQFAAENDSAGFGLDDVSVKPLPTLAFQSIQKSADNCALSWHAGAGVRYQVQYTAELAKGPWVNLGSPVPGAGQSLSVTDPDAGAGAAQKFYHLVLVP
jgi:hypothetical protein